MTQRIETFDREYHFLSNFYMHPVGWANVVYPSNEHAYQAAKTTDDAMRMRIRNAPTPGIAKKLGRGLDMRPDWDDVKLRVMTRLVRRKFADPKLAKKLLATGDAELVEGNWWGDTFWGVCRGKGENHLGRILMAERKRRAR